MPTCSYNFEAEVLGRLDLIIANQKAAAIQETKFMTALDDELATMTADMATQTTVVASLKPFIQGLFNQIAAIGLTPAQQTQLDAIKASIEANTPAISAAMVANTTP
jgi:hypothetical protein